jgi:hypothetical protein
MLNEGRLPKRFEQLGGRVFLWHKSYSFVVSYIDVRVGTFVLKLSFGLVGGGVMMGLLGWGRTFFSFFFFLFSFFFFLLSAKSLCHINFASFLRSTATLAVAQACGVQWIGWNWMGWGNVSRSFPLCEV